MHTTRSRRTTVAGIFLAAALAFTACGQTDEATADSAAEETVETEDLRSDAITQLEPGGAEILSQVPDLDFTEIDQDHTTVISSYGKELRVDRVAQTTTLPAETAEELLDRGFEYEPGDVVAAADGEIFAVAVLQADDPRWEPAGSSSDAKTALRVEGNELQSPHLSMEAGDQVTVVVAVPEDPGPETITAELIDDEVSQEISLIDGTRVSSDVEHIYERPTTVETTGNDSWSEEVESRREVVTMTGQFTEGIITPMVPKLGWANPGNVFLGLNLNTQELGNAHRDHSTIRLELADGTTVQPESTVRGVDGPFSHTAWFQLPVDATEATALINVKMILGTTEYDVTDIEIPLAISGSSADTTEESGTEADSDSDPDAQGEEE